MTEDDPSLGLGLSERLQKENFQVTWTKSFREAQREFALLPPDGHRPDLAILDLSLPDGSGFELARAFKEQKIPVIMMTALNSAENRLEAYEIGSEEFIPKPFHFRELLLRIQHVLDAHAPAEKPVLLDLPGGQLDLEKMCFRDFEGGITFLAPKDFQVLKILIEESPRPVHRDQILEKAWGHDAFPSQRTIDNSIVRIRQTLLDPDGEIIRSVRGVGYQWAYQLKED